MRDTPTDCVAEVFIPNNNVSNLSKGFYGIIARDQTTVGAGIFAGNYTSTAATTITNVLVVGQGGDYLGLGSFFNVYWEI